MACVVVTTVAALVCTAVERGVSKRADSKLPGVPLATRLRWLTTMLWGGSALLILEHVLHGEIVGYPPFLTAMSDPAATEVMLREMATVGAGMVAVILVSWALMVQIAVRVPAVRARLGLK